ncbi:DNA cytosine methyltransferase [Flavobacterium psychrophilum]|uniref:DNA cytosine methyltransferase n=1 Tax=Flavobacterium psychrophilum TaxID=96345 RepID=UPI001FC80C35|nr:DNA cytosine methyltransferase [Flavobacterium psychrophilum]
MFGTFVCGGGSTMGYKLAGFEHLGGVEIDKRMAKIYETNHNPKHFYLEDIRDFNQRTDLPSELYDLDILDGSPPCSTFSMSGNRELDWGKEKVFKEGQKKQTLDDLVFVYCDTIAKLRPKVAILENVCGIVAGRAKAYTIEICNKLDAIGYDVQIFQLNSATMGVPQARERVFFIARRKDIGLPLLTLKFNKKPIYFGSIVDRNSAIHKPLWASIAKRWEFIEKGDQSLKFADAKFRNLTTYNAFFSTNILYDDVVVPTLTSSGATVYYNEARNLNDTEYTRISSFPSDFDYCGSDVRYVCGMSVPPLMIARIANEIRQQWFTSNTI